MHTHAHRQAVRHEGGVKDYFGATSVQRCGYLVNESRHNIAGGHSTSNNGIAFNQTLCVCSFDTVIYNMSYRNPSSVEFKISAVQLLQRVRAGEWNAVKAEGENEWP